MNKENVVEQEELFKLQYARIRALSTAPDGYIYFSTQQNVLTRRKTKPGYNMACGLRPLDSNDSMQGGVRIRTVSV